MAENLLRTDTLQRLDQWYFNHMERAYTQETATEVQKHLRETIENADDPMAKLAAFGLMPIARRALERQRVLDSTEMYFSKQHADMRRSYDGLKRLAAKKELNKQYETLIPSLEKLLGFVQNVRSAMQQNPQLNDRDIDTIFLETFGDADSYVALWEKYMKDF